MFKLGVCKCCFGKVSSEAMVCPHCGQPNPYYDDSPDTTARDAYSLVLKGKKIEAIKLVRERKGWGLAEAKNFVESLKG
jgi:ribosomal protein L7/L12